MHCTAMRVLLNLRVSTPDIVDPPWLKRSIKRLMWLVLFPSRTRGMSYLNILHVITVLYQYPLVLKRAKKLSLFLQRNICTLILKWIYPIDNRMTFGRINWGHQTRRRDCIDRWKSWRMTPRATQVNHVVIREPKKCGKGFFFTHRRGPGRLLQHFLHLALFIFYTWHYFALPRQGLPLPSSSYAPEIGPESDWGVRNSPVPYWNNFSIAHHIQWHLDTLTKEAT